MLRGFTGEKQDIDSSHSGGQYDFLEREYNPVQGRWWTPDPAGLAAVDPNNPQTWNRYAYVVGTPLEATDPLGLFAVVPQGCVGMPSADPTTGDYYMCPLGPSDLPPWQEPTDVDSDPGGVIGSGPVFAPPAAPRAPNNGEPASPCLLANIAAVNAVSNLNVSLANVVGQPFVFNGGLDVNFSVPGASPAQLPAGRYPLSVLDRILGIGHSLHVPGADGGDPSTYGIDPQTGNFTFTTHIDTAYSTWHTPVGALIHGLVDVRDDGAHRQQCGGPQ